MFRKSNDASRKRTQERRSEKNPEKKPEKNSRKRREIKLLGGLAAGIPSVTLGCAIGGTGGLCVTWPMAVDRVSNWAASASTVIWSFTPPTFMLTSIVAVESTCSTIPVCADLLKPALVISSM